MRTRSHADEQRRPRRRTAYWIAAAVLGFVVLVAACSDETQDQIRDAAAENGAGSGDDEEAAAPPPEETQAPETTAAPEPAPEPAPETEEDEFSDEDWIIIIALGVIALLVIIGATSAATHHSDKKAAASSALDQRVREIVGGARWLHDQGSLEVIRTSGADQLRSSWAGVRASTVDLEAQITALRAGIDDRGLDGALAELGQRVTSLRGALESYVSLRTDPASQASLVEDASHTALERRRQLDAALQPLAVRR